MRQRTARVVAIVLTSWIAWVLPTGVVEGRAGRGASPADDALLTAARTGDVAGVKAALAHGADVNGADAGGRTALGLAAAAGHADVVIALVAAGAAVDRADGRGRVPLLVAAERRDLATTRALLAGRAYPNAPVPGGGTILHAALAGCERRDYDLPLIQGLVAAGASLTATDAAGRTARRAAEQRLRQETRPFFRRCYDVRADVLHKAETR